MSSTTAASRAAPHPSPATRAVRDVLPLAAATAPFGAVVGVTLDQAGLVGMPALAGTAVLYAGSAQLATLSTMVAGGGVVGAVVAGAVVNSRLLLYSASHGARFRDDQPAWFRWLAPLTTVDQTFALAAAASDLRGAGFRRYWTTMGLLLGTVWLAAVAVGMQLGAGLSAHGPLDVAAPATLVALLVPHLGDRRSRRAVLAAAAAALATGFLPAGLGIAVAVVAGLLVAGPADPDTEEVA